MGTSDLQPNWTEVVVTWGPAMCKWHLKGGNLLPLPQNSYAMAPHYHDAQSSEGKYNFQKQCSIIGKESGYGERQSWSQICSHHLLGV